MGLSDLAGLLERMAGPEKTVMAESRRLIRTGRELLAQNPGWRQGPADQTELETRLDALELAVDSVDGRLVIGLLGGTGVGKSTLISALAGKEISPAGPLRPITGQPVVYRHESFPVSDWLKGREVTHALPALRGLAIVDFPDFDSLEAAHCQTALEGLNRLDLVVWVTDYHKYADRRLYQVMRQARGILGPASQVVLLNKADELRGRTDGAEAVAEVLAGLAGQLADFGGWAGPPPWPVSAAESLAAPGEWAAGGLAPLRDLLDGLADEKLRRAVAAGNIEARSRDFLQKLSKPNLAKQWLAELEALQTLWKKSRPRRALDGDLAALALRRREFLAPRLAGRRQAATGLLGWFTDAWDFLFSRFRPDPGPASDVPEPAAPNLVRYLQGRSEDLALTTGRAPAWTPEELAGEAGALIRRALDDHLTAGPGAGSVLLWLWPPVLAALLIWAETGGQYGGPAALTAAGLRAAAPWLIFGFLGEMALSRFIWFRVRRHYETAFHRALNQALTGLLDLADQWFFLPLRREVETRLTRLDLLADLLGDDED